MNSRYLKILSGVVGMLAVLFAFQNCKNIQLIDDGKGNLVVNFDDGTTTSSDLYKGKVLKMNYFHGGWFSPFPNYRANLVLEVGKNRNTIIASLDAAKEGINGVNSQNMPDDQKVCKVKAEISVKDYVELEAIIAKAETKAYDNCKLDPQTGKQVCTMIADAGSESIDLYDSKALADASLKERIYLSSMGDGMNKGAEVFVDPAPVRAKVDILINKLKAKCGTIQPPATTGSDLKSESYTFDNGFDLPPEQAKQFNFTSTKRISWEVTLSGSLFNLKGEGSVRTYTSNGSSVQTRKYTNINLPISMKEAFLAQNGFTPDVVCQAQMVIGMKDPGTISLNYENSAIKGQLGCWSSPQIRDPSDFIGSVNSYLESLR